MSNDFFQQSFTPTRQHGSASGISDRSKKINGENTKTDDHGLSARPLPPPPLPRASSVPVKPPLQPPVHRSQAVPANKQSNFQNTNMMPAVKKTDNGGHSNSFLNNGNVNGYAMTGNVHGTDNNHVHSANSYIKSNVKTTGTSWSSNNSATGTMKRPTGNYYGVTTANASHTTTSTAHQLGGGGDSDADDWFTPSASTNYEKHVSSQNLSMNEATNLGYHTNNVVNHNPYFGSSDVNNNETSTSIQSQSSFNTHPQRSDSMSELYAGSMFSGPMSASNSSIPTSFTHGNAGAGSNIGGNISMTNFDDEPPLLEELGINLSHIRTKSLAVILPVRYAKSVIDTSIMEDNDMAGPLAFGLLLATELLLAGKIHFGYIYGFGMFGCLSTTLVLNLMSPSDSISIWTVVSVLGYSLLPVNFLAAINVFYRIKYMGSIGVILAAVTISWCTISSTRLIERGCGMRDQRYLVGYPNALLYSAFVMLTIF
mmetsp:Transcript_10964/g.20476  ORF Transcript_10964/g.20476 Transcript_10964/m.20476 type:complete len:483 (-) Transcript_10964:134-1582(-)